ncbi:MAG: hypothetical protein LCH99_07870 [Proteobacteria bacterium]|nr:hypothetical protein [Pseudomonadota bacterium]
MTENVSPPKIDVTEGLVERRVSMVDFPWRDLPVGEFGKALVSLVEIALGDGPDATAALARAFEGAEVLCECDLCLDAETIAQFHPLVETLREVAVDHPMLSANEWFLWGVDALSMAVNCSQSRDELFPYLRAVRLAAECFCAGRRLAARHGGSALTLQGSANMVN